VIERAQGGLPYKKEGDARWKLKKEPLRGTITTTTTT